MSNNETRISNERLAATIQRLIGKGNAMVGYMDSPEAIEAGAATSLASWQRETEAAMGLALQALRSTPVEAEPVAWRHRGPKFGGITTEERQPWSEQALFAHPLPNPSPSDEEVSEAALSALEELANMPLGISMNEWCRLSSPILTALQSKRGQP